jgi:hypothetical protein
MDPKQSLKLAVLNNKSLIKKGRAKRGSMLFTETSRDDRVEMSRSVLCARNKFFESRAPLNCSVMSTR